MVSLQAMTECESNDRGALIKNHYVFLMKEN